MKENQIEINKDIFVKQTLDQQEKQQDTISLLEKRNAYYEAKRKNLIRFGNEEILGRMGKCMILAADNKIEKNNLVAKEEYFSATASSINKVDNKLYIDPNCLKFFAKHQKGVTPADDALNSAFIACFAKTMQPITIDTYEYKGKKDEYEGDEDEYVIWEYVSANKNGFNKFYSTKNNVHAFINSIYGMFARKDDSKDDDSIYSKLKSSYEKNIKKEEEEKAVINFFVQSLFFNMFDRLKDGNVVVCDNFEIAHIDTQCHEDAEGNDGFLFSLKPKEEIEKKSKIVCCRFLSDNIKNNKENLVEKALEKCSNIDYDVFLSRYIRNCIFLNVKQKDALENLCVFLKRQELYFKNNNQSAEIPDKISDLNKKIERMEDVFKDSIEKNIEVKKTINGLKEQPKQFESLKTLLDKYAETFLINYNKYKIRENVFSDQSLNWINEEYKKEYKIIEKEMLKLSKNNDKQIKNFNISIDTENDFFSSFKRKCINTAVNVYNKIFGHNK